ncbi:MAG TPA: polyhydroxyalkanoic acid system family protein [Candidatus Acidoferrum sp.]|nr:polyhydroxyalkanoic acid system family protein [Candidatus Acidoferrum sp.]
MPNLKFSIPHKLTQDEALKRIQDAIAKAKAQNSGKVQDLQESWNGNVGTLSGSAMGHEASGTITVNPSDVAVDLALPAMAYFFKGTIEGKMSEFMAQLLA